MLFTRLIYIILFVPCLIILSSCVPKYPDSILDTQSFCKTPTEFNHSKYNISEMDERVLKRIRQWPIELQAYFKNKISDRFIMIESCKSKVKEWEIFRRCIDEKN
jgi:hypothetical protein